MIKELVTRFGFEIDDKALHELQEGIDAVKEGILHLGEALVGEAVGLYELVVTSAEAGVRLKIMGQETGIAAEKLQELQFRAKLADVSTEELNQSMNFLARNMNEARNGSEEARKHFRAFGITTAELRAGTVTTDQALERMSKRFQTMADGPKKTGLAMEVFGRSGARMVPFLNSLSTALSPVNQQLFEMSRITDEQIEKSEEFHINLETLKTGLMGIVRVIGFGLMPAATEIIETMKEWIVKNRELIVTNLTEFVKGMAAALKFTIKIVDALIQSMAGLAHAIGGVKIATELLLGAFALLSGLTILFGIGKVISAVYELAGAFAVADLAAAAIPIAIGAAMVAILLIMEDIYTFFTGGDSITGRLLKMLPEVGSMFKSIFEPIFEPFVAIITNITDGFTSWKKLFVDLGMLIVNVILTPFRAFFALLGGAVSILGRISSSDTIRKAGQSIIDNGAQFKLGGDRPLNIGPQAALTPETKNSKQVNNQLAVHQEFNFPPGTDPAVVGDKISTSVSDGLTDVLRSTNQVTDTGGIY